MDERQGKRKQGKEGRMGNEGKEGKEGRMGKEGKEKKRRIGNEGKGEERRGRKWMCIDGLSRLIKIYNIKGMRGCSVLSKREREREIQKYRYIDG